VYKTAEGRQDLSKGGRQEDDVHSSFPARKKKKEEKREIGSRNWEKNHHRPEKKVKDVSRRCATTSNLPRESDPGEGHGLKAKHRSRRRKERAILDSAEGGHESRAR